MAIDQLDLSALGRYLEASIDGFEGLQNAEKFSGGQSNPTYLLTTGSGQYALRRQPPGELLKSAHAVDREYRVIKALRETDVPVPQAIHLCEDRSVIGSMFYLMSFEQGRIFWDPSLPELDNQRRADIYDEMNRVLSVLHEVDVEAVGLVDYGKPGNYFERQVSRWSTQYRATETETIHAMDTLLEWLPENLPKDDGKVSLIHGDYRIDNLIFHPTQPHALALIDWELSTLGHPYADLAYQCMQWRLSQDAVIKGLGVIDRPAIGIPTEGEYIARYCERRQLPAIGNWDFYLAFSFFRLAAILQGVLKRAIDGSASSEKAFEYGFLAPTLASMGAELIDRR